MYALMLDFKVLLLVKKAMSPRWHSDNGPGSGTYSSEQQVLMLHPASIKYYAMHYIGYVLSSYTWEEEGGVFTLHQGA